MYYKMREDMKQVEKAEWTACSNKLWVHQVSWFSRVERERSWENDQPGTLLCQSKHMAHSLRPRVATRAPQIFEIIFLEYNL